jgi:hypothetical protein
MDRFNTFARTVRRRIGIKIKCVVSTIRLATSATVASRIRLTVSSPVAGSAASRIWLVST